MWLRRTRNRPGTEVENGRLNLTDSQPAQTARAAKFSFALAMAQATAVNC